MESLEGILELRYNTSRNDSIIDKLPELILIDFGYDATFVFCIAQDTTFLKTICERNVLTFSGYCTIHLASHRIGIGVEKVTLPVVC